MKKRMLAWLLVIFMAVSLFPVAAFAADGTTDTAPSSEEPEAPVAEAASAAIPEGAQTAGSAAEFLAAIAAIEGGSETEGTVVLTADVNDWAADAAFHAAAGKKLTVTSADGACHTLTLPEAETTLAGALTLDNVKLAAQADSVIYAGGNAFETTENFQGFDNAPILYGGGQQGQDVTGDSNITLRGSASLLQVWGGGKDSSLTGNVSILVDGDVTIGRLVGGGLAEATDTGKVGGNVEIQLRRGAVTGMFGGGVNKNRTDNTDGAREPAAVAGTVRITAGCEGAAPGSVCLGAADSGIYGGSWHSTVGNVRLTLLAGSQGGETTDTACRIFGCGYRDTVKGSVEISVTGGDMTKDSILGGGDAADSSMSEETYGPVEILNESGAENALKITYDTDGPIDNIFAGSAKKTTPWDIATNIKGNALIDVLDGSVESGLSLDGEILYGEINSTSDYYRIANCAIAGEQVIRIAGNGAVKGSIVGNYIWDSSNMGKYSGYPYDSNRSSVIFDGCGQAEAPMTLASGICSTHQIILKNEASVCIKRTPRDDMNVIVEKDCYLETCGIQKSTFEGYLELDGFMKHTLTVPGQNNAMASLYVAQGVKIGPTGVLTLPKFLSYGGDLICHGRVVSYYGIQVAPMLMEANIDLDGATLVATAVTKGHNYADPSDLHYNTSRAVFDLEHVSSDEYSSSGTATIYTTSPDDPTVLQNPKVGDYYVKDLKNNCTMNFVLGNEDAKPEGLYLKRVEDPDPDGWGRGRYWCWQVAQGVSVTFDKNGGDTEAEPWVTDVAPLEDGKTDYYLGLPDKAPTRAGYEFVGWNTAADGSGTAYTASTPVTACTRVYAQWRRSDDGGGGGADGVALYTLRYESNGGSAYRAERFAQDAIVQLDKVPVRAGYRFTGWYADPGLTERLERVRMTGDQTVYAGWRMASVPDLINGDDAFAYVIGYTDGSVRPDANISRAEVATLFFRLLKPEVRDGSLTGENRFTDVEDGMWFNKAVSTMAALGLVEGRSADVFDPDAPITRAEFAAICARFDTGMTDGAGDFADISGHWAEAEIKRAAAAGWITGYPDGTFRPDDSITRAEAMTLINRVLCRIPEDESDLLPGMHVWPDNQPDAWYYLAVQEATNSHDAQCKGELYEHWTALTVGPDWTRYQD